LIIKSTFAGSERYWVHFSEYFSLQMQRSNLNLKFMLGLNFCPVFITKVDPTASG